MRILAIVHETWAGPGVFGDVLRERGASLDEWLLPANPEPAANPLDYDAVLVLGGAMNVDEGDEHGWLGTEHGLIGRLLEREVPLIGLCLGGQMVARAAGAVPRRAPRPEIGWHEVQLTAAGLEDPVLGPLGARIEVFQWHGYEFPLPPGAVELARSDACLQACRIGEVAWALQFHPEVTRADALAWTEDWRADPDAVAIGLDPTTLALEIEEKIDAFNDLGRDICRHWLDVAAARS